MRRAYSSGALTFAFVLFKHFEPFIGRAVRLVFPKHPYTGTDETDRITSGYKHEAQSLSTG